MRDAALNLFLLTSAYILPTHFFLIAIKHAQQMMRSYLGDQRNKVCVALIEELLFTRVQRDSISHYVGRSVSLSLGQSVGWSVG